ncbi:MAG: glycoside hydrolase family 9 protein, partial [Chlamydiia bacterium]|nr:glycoside hydrolase family 9 protein [Chlamydiia bacterium]
AGSIDYSKEHADHQGGWHDAADWDRRTQHLTCVLDLLNAYEIAPQKFLDGQLNIPESGNGIPDILDEAEYGLRVWLKSQNAD